MIGEHLILKLKGNKYSICEDKFVEVETLMNRNFKEAYWEFEIINYFHEDKLIIGKIFSYQNGIINFPPNQKKISTELQNIDTIRFPIIDTDGLIQTERGSQKWSFSHKGTTIFPLRSSRRKPKLDTPSSVANNTSKKKIFLNEQHLNLWQNPKGTLRLKKTFNFPIKRLQFNNKMVSFEKRFSEYEKPIEISITNNDIIPEYDSIKNYFANILKTKKIKVSVDIEILDYKIIRIEAKSQEIKKITSELIENIKFNIIKDGLKKHIDNEKSIFTMEDFFENLGEQKIATQIFYENENAFFKDLLTISKPKHYKHLEYLSKIHINTKMKLRFIKKPFSFIFLIKGGNDYYIIWETIDTKEATYIWCIGSNTNELKEEFTKVKAIIEEILYSGKKNYIKSAENTFDRVYHDYMKNNDGFISWKNDLLKRIK